MDKHFRISLPQRCTQLAMPLMIFARMVSSLALPIWLMHWMSTMLPTLRQLQHKYEFGWPHLTIRMVDHVRAIAIYPFAELLKNKNRWRFRYIFRPAGDDWIISLLCSDMYIPWTYEQYLNPTPLPMVKCCYQVAWVEPRWSAKFNSYPIYFSIYFVPCLVKIHDSLRSIPKDWIGKYTCGGEIMVSRLEDTNAHSHKLSMCNFAAVNNA